MMLYFDIVIIGAGAAAACAGHPFVAIAMCTVWALAQWLRELL